MKRIIITLTAILSLIGIMVSPMTVFAVSDTKTSTVTGTLAATYTLTVSSTISLGALTPASGSADTTISQIQFVTDDSPVAGTSWVDLSVTDQNNAASNGGYLKRGATPLSTKFQVRGGEVSSLTDLPASEGTALHFLTTTTRAAAPEISGGTWTKSVSDGHVKQPAFASNTPGDYSLIIVFTATYHAS